MEIVLYYPCPLGATLQPNSSAELPSLTEDEEIILRYVAGYVPYKLMVLYIQYERSTSNEIVNVVECLYGMAVNGYESDVLAYTSKWMDLVNRGGAFEVKGTSPNYFGKNNVIVTLCFNPPSPLPNVTQFLHKMYHTAKCQTKVSACHKTSSTTTPPNITMLLFLK